MKQIYTLIIALVAAATAAAAPVIIAVSNGNWATTSTWNLNRIPQSGDTIVIPANMTIVINTTENLNGVVLKVAGTLNMTGGAKMNLDLAGFIQVQPSGSITGQSNNDQIKIGGTHVFKGAEPPIVGPKYADQTTGSGFSSYTMLPVAFVNFYVAKENDNVKILWSTASETNNNHFEIERSFDGSRWNTLAIIASKGNTNSTTNYSYTDKKVIAASVYYRIKQVDNDGKAMYTTTSSVKNSGSLENAQIFASNRNIAVSFANVHSNITIMVWSTNGQSVMKQSYSQSAYVSFQLKNAMPGLYIIQVIDENKMSESKKIFLN